MNEWWRIYFFSQSSGDEMVKVMFFSCVLLLVLFSEMLFLYFSILWLCYFEKLQHNDENNCLYMSGSWCFELFDSRQLQLHTLFKNKGVSIGNFWRQTYWIFFNALNSQLWIQCICNGPGTRWDTFASKLDFTQSSIWEMCKVYICHYFMSVGEMLQMVLKERYCVTLVLHI